MTSTSSPQTLPKMVVADIKSSSKNGRTKHSQILQLEVDFYIRSRVTGKQLVNSGYSFFSFSNSFPLFLNLELIFNVSFTPS